MSSNNASAADRHAALMVARDEADGKVKGLHAAIAQAQAAAHNALTGADFDGHQKHTAKVAELSGQLPAAEAALAALERAVEDVAREKAAAEHKTNRDRLADLVEARGLELHELIEDGIASLTDAIGKLRQAQALEGTFVNEQRALYEIRAELGEVAPAKYPNLEHPMEQLFVGVSMSWPAAGDLQLMRERADFFRGRLEQISRELAQ